LGMSIYRKVFPEFFAGRQPKVDILK